MHLALVQLLTLAVEDPTFPGTNGAYSDGWCHPYIVMPTPATIVQPEDVITEEYEEDVTPLASTFVNGQLTMTPMTAFSEQICHSQCQAAHGNDLGCSKYVDSQGGTDKCTCIRRSPKGTTATSDHGVCWVYGSGASARAEGSDKPGDCTVAGGPVTDYPSCPGDGSAQYACPTGWHFSDVSGTDKCYTAVTTADEHGATCAQTCNNTAGVAEGRMVCINNAQTNNFVT